MGREKGRLREELRAYNTEEPVRVPWIASTLDPCLKVFKQHTLPHKDR